MNYYPFHIGDYLSATRHLSWDEDAAYRRLLDVYYTQEGALPAEMKQVWRLVLATTEAQREAVQTVLEEFFELTIEGWVNTRADVEIEKMKEKQDKQRTKAQKRWHKPEQEPGNAADMPQHVQSDAVASKSDAVAMPPTPTPTPTPIDKEPNGSVGSKLPDCPAEDIVALYHDALPEMPRVKLMNEPRRKALRKFWTFVLTSKKTDGTPRAQTPDQALTWIRQYFLRTRENDFLMGRTAGTGSHSTWRCDLDFLLTDRGMKHVIEKTQAGETA